MKLRITLEVDAHELDRLVSLAYDYSWSREEPHKSWTDRERKEAARYAIEAIVSERVHGAKASARKQPHNDYYGEERDPLRSSGLHIGEEGCS